MSSNDKKKQKSYTVSDKFTLCKRFRDGKYSSMNTFLSTLEDEFIGIDKTTLCRWLKNYDSEKLSVVNANKRLCLGACPKTEELLVRYLETRQRLCARDKLGLDWSHVTKKAVEHNERVEDDPGFKSSPGWIYNMMKRHGIVGINVHGESGEMEDSKFQEVIDEWKPDFFRMVWNKKIPPERICNGDQTGFF